MGVPGLCTHTCSGLAAPLGQALLALFWILAQDTPWVCLVVALKGVGIGKRKTSQWSQKCLSLLLFFGTVLLSVTVLKKLHFAFWLHSNPKQSTVKVVQMNFSPVFIQRNLYAGHPEQLPYLLNMLQLTCCGLLSGPFFITLTNNKTDRMSTGGRETNRLDNLFNILLVSSPGLNSSFWTSITSM